jgi:regulator of sigma E protease
MEFLSGILSSLWSIFMIVLFFGGSIFVHELGHFLAARRRGVKATRFSIGMGPAIWSRTGKDGVEYRLAWFPIGGYVALPQLADMAAIEGESEDVSSLPPLSYSTKVMVFAAGAFFNVLFAFLLASILWAAGEPVSSNLASTTIAEVVPTMKNSEGKEVASPAVLAGLKPGDVIVRVDGHDVATFDDIVEHLTLSSGWNEKGEREVLFTIQRGGVTQDIRITPILSNGDKARRVGFSPVAKFVVEKVLPKSPAEKAGLQPGDQIIAIDQVPVLTQGKFVDLLRGNLGKDFQITVSRADGNHTLPMSGPKTAKTLPEFGFYLKSGTTYAHTPPWTQIAEKVTKTFRVLAALINPHSDLGLTDMSGPLGIGRIYWDASEAGIRYVLWIAILVNVNLAIFNLLPIPVLDGGHILFATIAKLRGRALPVNFIAATQSVFIILLFTMILYVTAFGDIRRWIRDVKTEAQEKAAATEQQRKVETAKPVEAGKSDK